ncbi:MAG TPA: hypothetical protein DCS66_25715, partial [Flavobacteriaceae bacterium]|nr:hypothetical protein [Flavobacteriaceae bacterium]
EERNVVIGAVYQSIIEAYPPFDLNFVCADINNGTFIEDMRDVMGSIYEQLHNAEAPTKRLKAIRTLNDVKSLDKYFKRNLIGQDQAVKAVTDSVKLIASGLYKTANFFFIGPTGVGKTELGRLLG